MPADHPHRPVVAVVMDGTRNDSDGALTERPCIRAGARVLPPCSVTAQSAVTERL
jgi:hypothetical protein